MGIIIYLNHDNTVRIRNERDKLKIENIELQKKFNILSDTLADYNEAKKLLQQQIIDRNRLIETLRGHFKTIQEDYDEEINDIHSDSTITTFRAINDIFRQHDSSID